MGKLATDRKRTKAIIGCPNGHQTLELSTSGKIEAVDELVDECSRAFDVCSKCGEEMGLIRTDEPKEELR